MCRAWLGNEARYIISRLPRIWSVSGVPMVMEHRFHTCCVGLAYRSAAKDRGSSKIDVMEATEVSVWCNPGSGSVASAATHRVVQTKRPFSESSKSSKHLKEFSSRLTHYSSMNSWRTLSLFFWIFRMAVMQGALQDKCLEQSPNTHTHVPQTLVGMMTQCDVPEPTHFTGFNEQTHIRLRSLT